MTVEAKIEPPDTLDTAPRRLPHGRINRRTSIPFVAVHVLPLLAIFTGVPWTAWVDVRRHVLDPDVLHHGRLPPLLRAPVVPHRAGPSSSSSPSAARSAAQKGPLWWAGHHRIHHRFTDTVADPHTPRKGFWWSHVGWILSDDDQRNARHDEGLREVPRDPVHLDARLDRAVDAGRRVHPDRRVAGTAHRLLPVDGPAVALDVPHQLGRPTSGAGGATRPTTPAGTTRCSRC